MRILVVTSQFPVAGEPNRGRPVLQTVQALSKIAQVCVVSPVARYPAWAQPRSYLYQSADAATTVPGCDARYVTYPALPVVSRPFNGLLCGRAIEQPLREFTPDVVLSYWLYPDAFGAMRAASRAGIPLVAGARGSDLRVRDFLSRHLTKPVVRSARRLLVVSHDLARVAEQDYGADAARIRTIPNGCNAATFHPRDRQTMRQALGLPQDSRLVAYVGRLVPEKGLKELFDAFTQLSRDDARLSLVLVGDGPMRAALEQRAAALPPGRVSMPGALDADDVARWMAAADVVTLPSYSEGHPNVLVEALACGRPVVATPVGGIPEVVDADAGLLVAVRDGDALAQGLRQTLAASWDEAALATRFSRGWDQVAAETLRACEEALGD